MLATSITKSKSLIAIHSVWFIRNTSKFVICLFLNFSENVHMLVAYLFLNFIMISGMLFLNNTLNERFTNKILEFF